MQIRPDERIPSLDGFRGLAILLVLFSHSLIYQSDSLRLSRFATACGSVGVTFFFVLSGFLITRLLIAEHSKHKHVSFKMFYARRALRILPPYLIYIVTVVILVALHLLPQINIRDAAISFVFARNLVGRSHETAHLWSLSLEEQFYAFWPFAFVLIVNRRAMAFLIAAILVIPIWRLVAVQLDIASVGALYMRTDMRIDSLLIGCLLAFVLPHAQERATGARGISVFGSIAVFLSSGLAVSLASAEAQSLEKTALLHSLVPLLGCFALLGLIISKGIYLAAIFKWAPLVFVGKLSYSLYLWQQLFLGPDETGLSVIRAHVTYGIAMTVTCSVASYFLIERPCLRFKSRWNTTSRRSRGEGGVMVQTIQVTEANLSN